MSNSNFTEWTREQKAQFAEKRMLEMRLKNAELQRRYAEVEDDRIAAESKNSAITNASKALKKEKNTNTFDSTIIESRVEHTREWDRGKPDKDNWKSPEHHGSFKNYRTGRYDRRDSDRKDSWGSYSKNDGDDSWNDHTSTSHHERKDNDRRDNWGGYSRNESSDHYRHDRASDSFQNRKTRGSYRYKQHDNDQPSMSRLHTSPKRTRGVGYRNNDSHRKSQHSYSDEKYKKPDFNRTNSRKKYPYRAHSRSSSRSDSDRMDNNISTIQLSNIKAASLWHNDKISEDQNKQNRVENWVKTVNKSNMWNDKKFSSEQKDKSGGKSYSKFDRFEHSPDRSSNEDTYLPNFNIPGESKSRENSNFISQRREYHESKRLNRGASSYNVPSNSTRQNNDGYKKGFRAKRSPQYSSAGSGKNEHYRKQRRFDNKGYKNDDDKNKFSKSKIHDSVVSEKDTWKNSIGGSRDVVVEKRDCNKNSKFDNDVTWDPNLSWGPPPPPVKQCEDGWGPIPSVEQNEDGWGPIPAVEQSLVDDGWGAVDQSDIKWRLSDEETDVKNQNKKSVSVKESTSDDPWNDNVEENDKKKYIEKNENINKASAKSEDSYGIWGDVEQNDVKWNIPEAETDSQEKHKNFSSLNSNKDEIKQNNQHNSDVRDGSLEDYQSESDIHKRNLNEIAERMDEKCKIQEGLKPDDGSEDAEIVEGGSSSGATKFEQSLDALSQKSHKKNTGGSDDGGWTTVSEEGEIHSDEDDVRENTELCNKDTVQN